MSKKIGGAVAAATLAFASGASAGVTTLTYTLPASDPYFENLSPGIDLGDLYGAYTVTIRSTRAFMYADAWTAEYVDWHVHPLSGPSAGYGGDWFENNQTGYRQGPQAISIDFLSTGSTAYYGCCELSGDEWVPYEEMHYRSSMLFPSIDFVAGDAPITVTISFAPVPEPATWAMMIIGFGAVGSAIRSLRRQNAVATA